MWVVHQLVVLNDRLQDAKKAAIGGCQTKIVPRKCRPASITASADGQVDLAIYEPLSCDLLVLLLGVPGCSSQSRNNMSL